ncbi:MULTISPECIES: hypothetical protein [Francisella]|uniref:Uncharacterized protein n=1 Tax=Francisella opportunistica TaxID=2016517 RepID=A0A345JPL5_9GAMM|nr:MULTISPECIES: hypothetical protein [Francisella]APC90935.1 hypothetical protein BBG19_0197 [Francisella sp. MA067296]AXH29261.1 hypothetical protein CGC43_00980 [Francisella opportunistica]AXH30912.1 hypothetical protein CGC44_00975 [Francisella opportunistica]AXH32559.1 hypothetical protein CGC45_00975 [Francisella opportunistica]
MDIKKLKQVEENFLSMYPEGFYSAEMQKLAKKHKMEQMIKQTQGFFGKNFADDVETACENMVKIVNQSSMVSLFEKPKFRDAVKAMSTQQKKDLVEGLELFLHDSNKQQQGFDKMLDVLKQFKLAKWSLLTIIPNYYHPDREVFVKPTTAKSVIGFFKLEGLVYKPQPSWSFYQNYRKQILDMKNRVNANLATNNAAFCGFLMMSI